MNVSLFLSWAPGSAADTIFGLEDALQRGTTSVTSALVLVVLTATRPAAAEEASQDALAEAGARFDRGVQLYRERSFEAALAEFLRAHEVAPNFAVLYNIGQVYAQLGRNPDAVRTFERFLEEGGQRVRPLQRAEVEAELQRLGRLVARIEVAVTGPASAVVLVDEIEVGRTPLVEPLLVDAGRHVVEARAPGFLPSRREVMVAGGAGVALELALDRAEAPGAVLVTVNVPSATITLDGADVGTSPLPEAVTAAAGHHVVEVAREGYEPVRIEVDVASGEVARLEVSLAPDQGLDPALSGSIELAVSEDGTEAFLDGAPMPSGPVPAGAHVVEVRRAGFEDWRREVDVPAGQTARIEATLRPTPAYLEQYRERAGRYRLAAWITGGLGVAIAGTAIGFFIWNAGRNTEWEDEEAFLDAEWSRPASERTLSEQEIEERYDANEALGAELQNWNAVEWALLGVGAAALVTSIVLFAAGPRPGRYTEVSLSPTPGGVMAGLTLRTP